jgi:hypothetical protein
LDLYFLVFARCGEIDPIGTRVLSTDEIELIRLLENVGNIQVLRFRGGYIIGGDSVLRPDYELRPPAKLWSES